MSRQLHGERVRLRRRGERQRPTRLHTGGQAARATRDEGIDQVRDQDGERHTQGQIAVAQVEGKNGKPPAVLFARDQQWRIRFAVGNHRVSPCRQRKARGILNRHIAPIHIAQQRIIGQDGHGDRRLQLAGNRKELG